jgi:hypothetical protein
MGTATIAAKPTSNETSLEFITHPQTLLLYRFIISLAGSIKQAVIDAAVLVRAVL